MYPTFHLFGPLSFPAYFTLLLFGFMLAIWLGWREQIRIGGDANKFLDLALWMLIWGVVGARILHVFADGHFWDYVYLCVDPTKTEGKPLWTKTGLQIPCVSNAQCLKQNYSICFEGLCHPGRDCLRVFKIWYGGLAYYGGFIAAVAYGMWFIKKHKLDFWKTCDIGGFGIPLGLVFGRLGCFFSGCCFGKTCAPDVGLRFPRWSPAWWQHFEEMKTIGWTAKASLPVHPTQLYSAFANLLIFAYLYLWLRKRKSFDGQVWWMFVVLYAASRFVIEFFRNDDRGVFFGGLLSTSQLIGVPLIAAAVIFMLRLKRRQTTA